jgi:hypothetical protein
LNKSVAGNEVNEISTSKKVEAFKKQLELEDQLM